MSTTAPPLGCQLSSARLRLVPISDQEVALLVRLWDEAAIARYLWDDQMMTPERASAVVRASDRDFRSFGYGVWSLYELNGEALAGICGLRRVHERDWVEVLFSLRQRYRGQGLATEAAFAVLEHAFSVLGLERVVAIVDPANVPSVRVLSAVQMSFFAKDGSRVYWSVTPAEFFAASIRPPPPVQAT